MKIGVVGSMQYSEYLVEYRDQLIALGHDAYVTTMIEPFIGKTDDEKEAIKLEQKFNQDAMREFWRLMQDGDAILVVNLDKHGTSNYIGANTFLEVGWAHVLEQQVYLLNPVPDQPYIATELAATRPIVINGDLSLIQEPKRCDGTSVGVMVWRQAGITVHTTTEGGGYGDSWSDMGPELLLVKSDEMPFGWAPPTGHLDGQPPPIAARRVLHENGLVAGELDLRQGRHIYNLCGRGGHLHHWYLFRLPTYVDTPESRSQIDANRVCWLGINSLQRLALRTKRYQAGEVSQADWQRDPGLEPVWVEILTGLDVI